eukprot:TRINITY_DN206_c0_g1_i1.p1 TRINITY_DN206_c0_g1~~TRINITY_DN206_c0_g1_i1.p1  ORF type:complete len:344 (-),score=70.56 TRINITY_DN206_c0_g1_i1:91-1059(-)
MSERKVIVVGGATGKQGGSFICHLLESKFPCTIRGLTRNCDTECCEKLKSKGVEMFKCDFTHPCNNLDKALKDADIFFCLTDAFDPKERKEEEYNTGVKLVDAAIKNHVKHIIFSTLPNVEKISGGKLDVPHFTHKARIEDYIRSKKSSFKEITFVAPGFYFQNLLDFGLVKYNGKELMMRLPMKETSKLAGIDIRDYGKVLVEILRRPQEFRDKVVPICSEELTLREYAKVLGEVLGVPVKWETMDKNTWTKEFGKVTPLSNEFWNMFSYIDQYGYCSSQKDKCQETCFAKKIVGDKGLHSFRDWMTANKTDSRWLRTTGP